MNVQFSDKARKILSNKKLASKIFDSVIVNNDKLNNGDPITVKDDNSNQSIKITLVSSNFQEKGDQ